MTVTGQVTVNWFLRLDISVENSIAMHMINWFQHLIHVILHSLLRQIVPPALDGLIHVHVHQFEDKCKSPGGLITTNSGRWLEFQMKRLKSDKFCRFLTRELRVALWYSDVVKDVSKLRSRVDYLPIEANQGNQLVYSIEGILISAGRGCLI